MTENLQVFLPFSRKPNGVKKQEAVREFENTKIARRFESNTLGWTMTAAIVKRRRWQRRSEFFSHFLGSQTEFTKREFETNDFADCERI